MKKILLMLLMFSGLVSSLFAVETVKVVCDPPTFSQWGEIDYAKSTIAYDLKLFAIKPDNPISLVALGIKYGKNEKRLKGADCYSLNTMVFTQSTFKVGWHRLDTV